MDINIMDGGMIFELNKKYSDYGEYAVQYDQSLIDNLYKNYIRIGCKFITTCNYCFKPSKLKEWEKYTKLAVDLVQKYRKNTKVFGCVPPFFDSYKNGEVDDNFVNYYQKLCNILKDKIDIYLIETSVSINHVSKIYEIIKKIDPDAKIIISLYPNSKNEEDISKYFDLDLYGLFLNCCSFNKVIDFHDKFIKKCSKINNINTFGFNCNKINEKEYSKNCDIKQLQNFKKNKTINRLSLNNFIQTLDYKNIYIGGCCGYGVKEMEELINEILPN